MTHSQNRKTSKSFPRATCLALTIAIGAPLLGCVERTISINSEPDNALVILNDQEIGRTPVKVDFTWYGDYDIIIRKQGYQTLKTNRRIKAPWYQYPGIDLFTECFSPITYRDDRDFGTFQLEKFQPATKQALIQSAEELRARSGVTTTATSSEPTIENIESPPATNSAPIQANPAPRRSPRPPADGVMRPVNE